LPRRSPLRKPIITSATIFVQPVVSIDGNPEPMAQSLREIYNDVRGRLRCDR
jgi:hypothetical protein